MTGAASLSVRPDIAAAVAQGVPIVALESTLVAHGLQRPENLEVARHLESIVAEEGALAATVAVIEGRPTVGLEDWELELIATAEGVPKLGVRDLPSCMAAGRTGATTVASTAHLAALAGIEVFATGGMGGVHRGARDSFDESADLLALATTPILLVCAGVKSILDVAATLQRLETLGVPVVGYDTLDFPGFYLASSGHELQWSVADPREAAAVFRARTAAGVDDRALVVAAALPSDEQLDPDLHDRVLHEGLAQAERDGVTGIAVTPFLLDYFHQQTQGQSLAVNISIIERNARLAARIAVALTR